MNDTTPANTTDDTAIIDIHGIAHGGAGVGRPAAVDAPVPPPSAHGEQAQGDALVWFVQGALPGERVRAVARKRAKRHVQGDVVEVLQAAPERVTPPCQYATSSGSQGPACGGCAWQFVRADAQAEHKLEIVRGQLRRLPLEVKKVLPSPAVTGYRRRARMHYRNDGLGFALGFFGSRSHEVVDVASCMVLEPVLDRAFMRLRDVVAHLPESGEVVGLTDGKRAVLGLPGVKPSAELAEALEGLLDDELVGITMRGGRQRQTVGIAALAIDEQAADDEVTGLPPMVAGPFVFTQAQARQNDALVRHVVKAARADGRKVLELFCGAGNFTRGLAQKAEGIWASDDDREAIARLRELAVGTRLPIRARKDSAQVVLSRLVRDERTYDVVVLDPPRTGLGREATEMLARVAAKRIVYVSCDPATLARDLQVLIDAGFEVADVRVFDLMPMTAEVEVVATLRRVKAAADVLPPHVRDAEREANQARRGGKSGGKSGSKSGSSRAGKGGPKGRGR